MTGLPVHGQRRRSPASTSAASAARGSDLILPPAAVFLRDRRPVDVPGRVRGRLERARGSTAHPRTRAGPAPSRAGGAGRRRRPTPTTPPATRRAARRRLPSPTAIRPPAGRRRSPATAPRTHLDHAEAAARASRRTGAGRARRARGRRRARPPAAIAPVAWPRKRTAARSTSSPAPRPTPYAIRKPKKPKGVAASEASADPPTTTATASAAPTARSARSGFRRTRAERGMRAHDAHLMPTGACTMQSGQIGSPQFAQETSVSTDGWLTQRGIGLVLDGSIRPDATRAFAGRTSLPGTRPVERAEDERGERAEDRAPDDHRGAARAPPRRAARAR